MTCSRKLCRRSFLACVTGGAPFLVLARAAAAPQPAEHPPSPPEERTQVYDTDKGQNTDNWNIGGARGVGRARVAQCSDQDNGPGADPLGESRTRFTYSDTDRGRGSDPSGRKCPRPWYAR